MAQIARKVVVGTEIAATGAAQSGRKRHAGFIGVPQRLVNLRPAAFVALYAVVSYAILAALTVSALVLGGNAVSQQVDLRMRAATTGSAEFVDQRLQSRAGLLAFVANRPSLIDAMRTGHADTAGTLTLNGTVAQLEGGTEGGYAAFIAWRNGILAATTTTSVVGQDFSGRDWFQGALRTNGPYVSAAYQGAASPHPLVVAESIKIVDAQHRVLGVVGVSFELTKISAFVNAFATAQGISLLVTDQTGTVVAKTGAVISSLDKMANPDVSAALAGRTGNDNASSQFLAAYAPASSSHWAVVAQVPRDQALSGLALMQRSVILAASLLGLVNLGMVAVLSGATRRRARAEAELGKANDQLAHRLSDVSLLASIVDSSEDAILSKTLDGTITSWNPGAEAMYGYTADEIVGKSVSLLFPPEKRSTELADILGRVRAGVRIKHFETLRLRRDGTAVPVSLGVSPIRGSSGEISGAASIERDISEERRAARYARSLLEASLDPLVTISPEGKITDVNDATVRVTGVKRAALIGTDFSEYFTERDHAQAGYRRVFAEGTVTDYPLTIRAVDGHLTPVLYNASVYRDADGKVLGVFAAARDVTDQKLAEEEIRQLNSVLERRVKERTSELEASNHELEAFTYSVSHDLRAPLRAMAGFAGLLSSREASSLSQEGRQYVSRIAANSNTMGILIDDLLRFARLGRASMTIETVQPESVAKAALADLIDVARAGGVEVVFGPLPECRADESLLKQVYANLLANAIKFSRGRPGARVEVTSHLDDGTVVYDVKDNGVGFDMRYADKLFGVFQRLHRQADFEGTGVGLAIVQRIIHRHGGHVWAEAEVDKGATFHFTLNAARE